jgi:hypothetical protein
MKVKPAVRFDRLGRLFTSFVLGAMRMAGGSDASKLRPIDGRGHLYKPIFVMTGADNGR